MDIDHRPHKKRRFFADESPLEEASPLPEDTNTPQQSVAATADARQNAINPNAFDDATFKSIVGDDVSLAGQMHGLWHNPFGVSPNVTVGPDLALQLQINLLLFVATGTPTSFGFDGEMAIGHTEGKVAVQVSEDPLRRF